MNSSSVAVIIVNYNGHEDTIECLESLLNSTHKNFNVVVVDNSDSNESWQALHSWATIGVKKIGPAFEHLVFPLVNKPIDCDFILKNDRHQCLTLKPMTFLRAGNRGFAAASNEGMAFINGIVKCDYFWLLNNDTVVESQALNALVETATQYKRVGVWGSKLMQYYDPTLLQGVGGRYYKWVGKVKEIGFNKPDHQDRWKEPVSFDYVIGASMFVTAKFFEEVGMLDEALFLYYEELDWALRGKQKGWTLGYCNASVVYHKMGASIQKKKEPGRNSLAADFYSARNRILLAKRYFPWTLITLYPSFLVFIFRRIINGQFSRIRMLFEIIKNPECHLKSESGKLENF